MHIQLEVEAPRQSYGISWKRYIPLFVVVTLALFSASAKQAAYGGWNWMTWMQDFMGFLMIVFSAFKLFDLKGYADVFQQYDLLAGFFRPYAFCYPFIQLSLGLGYLSQWQPAPINSVTLGVTVFGSMGVFRACLKGRNLKDGCMGTMSHVPLSAFTLLEDLGMALMAGVMLFV